MNKIVLLLGGLVMVVSVTACGKSVAAGRRTVSQSRDAATVTGRVAGASALANARAVAVASNGKQYTAYLDKSGDFTLTLPVDSSYRMLIANDRAGGKADVGQLTLDTRAGRAEWLERGTVDLGVLTASLA